MQELHKHFIDAWSSPGDCWNPGKVIDKIESMIEKEKEQIQKAFSDGQETPINHPTLPHYSREEYYNDNYNQDK